MLQHTIDASVSLVNVVTRLRWTRKGTASEQGPAPVADRNVSWDNHPKQKTRTKVKKKKR